MPEPYIKSTGYQKLFKKAKPAPREVIGPLTDAKEERKASAKQKLIEARRRIGQVKGGYATSRRYKGPPPSRVGM